MKLIELIEMLQEEYRITPHADVNIRVPTFVVMVGNDSPELIEPVECNNNHHTVTIVTE